MKTTPSSIQVCPECGLFNGRHSYGCTRPPPTFVPRHQALQQNWKSQGKQGIRTRYGFKY